MTAVAPAAKGGYACACGGPKDFYSKRCWACWKVVRGPADPDRKAQYRREHQARITEYARKWRAAHLEQVRAYHRNYQARYRAEKREAHFEPCPLCDGRKAKAREFCKRCTTELDRRDPLRIVTGDGVLACWSCSAPLRKASWRGLEFLKCPSCGLEIKKAPMYTTKEAKVA